MPNDGEGKRGRDAGGAEAHARYKQYEYKAVRALQSGSGSLVNRLSDKDMMCSIVCPQTMIVCCTFQHSRNFMPPAPPDRIPLPSTELESGVDDRFEAYGEQ